MQDKIRGSMKISNLLGQWLRIVALFGGPEVHTSSQEHATWYPHTPYAGLRWHSACDSDRRGQSAARHE